MAAFDDSDFQGAIDELRVELGFDFVSLSLVPATERPVLTWQYASGNLNDRYKRIVLASGRGIVGMVYKTGRALLLADVHREIPDDEMHEYPIVIAEALASVAAVPLWKGGDIGGILLAGFRYVNGVDDALLQKLTERLAKGFFGYSVDAVEVGNRIERADDDRPVYELMTHRVLEAQEMERRRISRELHDGIAQEVLGVQMVLRETKYLDSTDEKDEHIARAIEGLGGILDEVRRLAVELRPSSLDNLGLQATLQAHTAWVSNSFGVRVHFESNIGDRRFRPAVETAIYRVCQEAVLNACKYSEADDIEVSLKLQGEYLVLLVRDRGLGFDMENFTAKGTGLGLEGMQERAELVDGYLSIASGEGVGTSVELIVPISDRAEDQSEVSQQKVEPGSPAEQSVGDLHESVVKNMRQAVGDTAATEDES